jgi:hypothetical protein
MTVNGSVFSNVVVLFADCQFKRLSGVFAFVRLVFTHCIMHWNNSVNSISENVDGMLSHMTIHILFPQDDNETILAENWLTNQMIDN